MSDTSSPSLKATDAAGTVMATASATTTGTSSPKSAPMSSPSSKAVAASTTADNTSPHMGPATTTLPPSSIWNILSAKSPNSAPNSAPTRGGGVGAVIGATDSPTMSPASSVQLAPSFPKLSAGLLSAEDQVHPLDFKNTPAFTFVRMKLLKTDEYERMKWKNGLGETQQIAIYPPSSSYQDESFIWRLSRSTIDSSCHFSLYPGYQCHCVLLDGPTMSLRHNDEETPVPVKPLIPYSWNGGWPTSCKLKGAVTDLNLIVDRKNAKATVDVLAGLNHGQPVERLFLKLFTLIYVVNGSVRISTDEQAEDGLDFWDVDAGETLMVARGDEADPTHAMIVTTSSADANVILIQISEKPLETVSPKLMPTLRRKGSIIVYDDQPLWALPQELADKMPISPMLTASSQLPVQQWAPAQLYQPPLFSSRFKNESEVPPPVIRDRLVIDDFPIGKISTAWINMVKQGLSEWIRIPVIVARGTSDGPVVGITAAVHGNELNGVPCIHRVVTDIDVKELKGTVVAVPCVNVPGYLRFTREFSDGKDLNRLFPGQEDGTASQIYAYYLMNKIIHNFNFLIDLHTASFGRVNSYYVRSDMNDPISATMAKLQRPQIILHNSGQDGTLRSACMSKGIRSITVEIGNPQLFQNQFIQWSYMGVMRILAHLEMFTLKDQYVDDARPLLCSKGFWLYTKTGGVLEVYPVVNSLVRKGDLIARIKNIFGNIVDEVFSPTSGVVIGRSSNPVAMAGDRIAHIGIVARKGEQLPAVNKENY